MADDKIKLGVLWKNLSREGNKPYLSGRAHQDNLEAALQLLRDGGRFLILSAKKRPDKQDPDCELFVVPEREKREERPTPAAHAAPPASPPKRPQTGARPAR